VGANSYQACASESGSAGGIGFMRTRSALQLELACRHEAGAAVTQKTFRISTGLKDLIGQDLITDDFVAVFELVKNCFDAHARRVHLLFEKNRIVIADDGKGMSHADILNKWLFVAYSAKREGTEDDDYRDHVRERARPFAGAKGVGRFSCDRLGAVLTMASRAKGQPVQVLDVDWKDYEGHPRVEFSEIEVKLTRRSEFPEPLLKPRGDTGTILEIGELRSGWDREKLGALKRELTKLIDPFASGNPKFQIKIIAPDQKQADDDNAAYNASIGDDQKPRLIVNGLIENPIVEVIGKRTTAIKATLTANGKFIETTLEDRGELIYKIREKNEFWHLSPTGLKADVYFLNRSAKAVFARRMGLASVQFGSIFLFRNGFRVFPIGAEDDDFFGLNRRKAQGQRRYLGSRDLIGRIDIKGVSGFDEATSRNQGLIKNEKVEQLIEFVRDKCIRRLERYVVDITWKDSFDTDLEDMSRMKLDDSSALVTQLVARLAATEGVELLEYNPDLVRLIDEKSSAFEASLGALELLAEETGDKKLMAKVEAARERIRALELAEAEAREAERRAQSRAMAAENAAGEAEKRFSEERERNAFLVAASSLDQDTVLNLHHQIMGHAFDVQHNVKRMMAKLRTGIQVSKTDWIDFLEKVSYRNGQIITAARFATKGGYKQQSTSVEADLSGYIIDYIETVASLWAPRGIAVQVDSDGKVFKREFRPIEIGMVIDNLVSNAAKARAENMLFRPRVTKGQKPTLEVEVADDGAGWAKSFTDLSRIFEKGVTTTDGSGLGLYHVMQLIEGMKGVVEPIREPYSGNLNGAHLILKVPT
jgi:signal transduction histidine kinase